MYEELRIWELLDLELKSCFILRFRKNHED